MCVTNEGRKEIFYLTTLSTYFILWLYGIQHMVKDHSNSLRGNLLLPHRILFLISSKGSFICRITHTTAFVTPALAGTRNSSMGSPRRNNPMTHHTMSKCSYHGATVTNEYRNKSCWLIVLFLTGIFFFSM